MLDKAPGAQGELDRTRIAQVDDDDDDAPTAAAHMLRITEETVRCCARRYERAQTPAFVPTPA